jgi:hypothetical protein
MASAAKVVAVVVVLLASRFAPIANAGDLTWSFIPAGSSTGVAIPTDGLVGSNLAAWAAFMLTPSPEQCQSILDLIFHPELVKGVLITQSLLGK